MVVPSGRVTVTPLGSPPPPPLDSATVKCTSAEQSGAPPSVRAWQARALYEPSARSPGTAQVPSDCPCAVLVVLPLLALTCTVTVGSFTLGSAPAVPVNWNEASTVWPSCGLVMLTAADAAGAPTASTTTATNSARNPCTPLSLASVERFDLAQHLAHRGLRVAEQECRVLEVEERVVDACEARVHRPLEHDHRAGLV